MCKLILLDGSPYVGKTSALQTLEEQEKLYHWEYEKPKLSSLRQINFIGSLYRAYFEACVTPGTIALDRSPFSYYVWSKLKNITPDNCPPCIFTEWKNVMPWLKYTVLVFKEHSEFELGKISMVRGVPYHLYKKEQEFYKHYALEKPYLFRKVITLKPHEFLTPKHLSDIL